MSLKSVSLGELTGQAPVRTFACDAPDCGATFSTLEPDTKRYGAIQGWVEIDGMGNMTHFCPTHRAFAAKLDDVTKQYMEAMDPNARVIRPLTVQGEYELGEMLRKNQVNLANIFGLSRELLGEVPKDLKLSIDDQRYVGRIASVQGDGVTFTDPGFTDSLQPGDVVTFSGIKKNENGFSVRYDDTDSPKPTITRFTGLEGTDVCQCGHVGNKHIQFKLRDDEEWRYACGGEDSPCDCKLFLAPRNVRPTIVVDQNPNDVSGALDALAPGDRVRLLNELTEMSNRQARGEAVTSIPFIKAITDDAGKKLCRSCGHIFGAHGAIMDEKTMQWRECCIGAPLEGCSCSAFIEAEESLPTQASVLDFGEE